MSATSCPECGETIPVESINIAEGVALCSACGQLSRLSDVASGRRPVVDVLSHPPRGCSLTESDQEIVATASLRSVAQGCSLVFVALFWNGITSVFLLIAFAGIYTNLIGPLPHWFPAPNDPNMTLGMSLFLCVFMTPFVAVGTGMIIGVLTTLFGKVDVHIGENEGRVRTGIGRLVWTRRFDPTAVRQVTGGQTSWTVNDQRRELIVIEADNRVEFGSMLDYDRREWLLTITRELLLKPSPHERQATLEKAVAGLVSR